MDSVTQPVLRFAGDIEVWYVGDVHCTEEPEERLLFPQIAAQSFRQGKFSIKYIGINPV